MTTIERNAPAFDVANDLETLYREVIVALKGAFSREYVAVLVMELD
jgi:hypothetical protein